LKVNHKDAEVSQKHKAVGGERGSGAVAMLVLTMSVFGIGSSTEEFIEFTAFIVVNDI
jgi:hypothetical protein